MYTKELNDRWVQQMAAVVRQRTGLDISSLLRDGPGRILLNLCNKTGLLPGAFADENTLRHIMDWLVASKVRNEPWLTRLDAEGRPLKLMKCGTIERLTHEADRAMKRWNSRPGVAPSEGAELVFDCGEGYSVFKLVTAAALDVESGLMGHCVGNGGYDTAVENGELEIYSLRDGSGKSHVTIEMETRRRRITQMMGKANTRVKPEYMRRLIPWFNHDRELDLWDAEMPPGFEIDRNRQIVELAALRPGDSFDGELHLRVFEDTEEYIVPLPENFTVLGDLTISAHRRMDYNAGQAQPYNFHGPIGGRDWSREKHGPVLKMPTGLNAEGKLTLHGFRAGIDAKAYSYHLVACRVESLPETIDRSAVMTECHVPAALSGIRFEKNFVIENCGAVEFGDAIHVKGEMTLSNKSDTHGRPVSIAFKGGCRVEGNLTSKKVVLEAGSDVTVDGSVSFMGGEIAAERISVEGDFITYDTTFNRMPHHLKVGGDARFDWARIDRWPTTMEVGGRIKDGGATILGSDTPPQSQPGL
ncbi:PcfJ domain-containing protein [Pararhizobium sp. BT-229]|uniref:PcfJ domain-containing protein n=1 Tax=Pararhizobium sp. BT-229 TaxID=2986923 RepID=UPI0021F7C5FB|nr:PcfJ domain-containing protein [Pararhizobium sp. BT-229]MCV9963615.1 PcfJ domain-containing protein [Pararhizobium sp. BT-229]